MSTIPCLWLRILCSFCLNSLPFLPLPKSFKPHLGCHLLWEASLLHFLLYPLPTALVWVKNFSYKLWFRKELSPLLLERITSHKRQTFPEVSLERVFLHVAVNQGTTVQLVRETLPLITWRNTHHPEWKGWVRTHTLVAPLFGSFLLIGILITYFVRKILGGHSTPRWLP